MFCSQCGAQLRDGARFCSQCGAEVRTPQQASSTQETASTTDDASQTDAAFNQHEAILVPTGNTHTDSSSSGFPSRSAQQASNQQTTANGQPFLYGPAALRPPLPPSASGVPFMKWYKTVIWALLPLCMLSGIINGLGFLTGARLQGVSSLAYGALGFLRITDFATGLILIGSAVAAFFIRQKLVYFKTSAPRAFLSLLLLLTILSIYNICVSYLVAMLPLSSIGSSYSSTYSGVLGFVYLLSAAWAVAYYFLNKAYFRNRAHLFVNPD